MFLEQLKNLTERETNDETEKSEYVNKALQQWNGVKTDVNISQGWNSRRLWPNCQLSNNVNSDVHCLKLHQSGFNKTTQTWPPYTPMSWGSAQVCNKRALYEWWEWLVWNAPADNRETFSLEERDKRAVYSYLGISKSNFRLCVWLRQRSKN